MKLKNILIAGTLLGGASFAQADDRSFGDGTLPEFLQQYDVNEDSVIDEEERQAIKAARKAAREERRAEIDTDGDGEISSEERDAARDAIRERIAAKRAEKFAEIAGEDGVLSLEEFAALPPLQRASEERVASIFDRLDADDSGAVSLEEFNARLRFHRPPSRPRPGGGGPRPGDGPDDGEGPRPPAPAGRR
ncbi:MAG: Ca2+-binding EF-hand superfamily protein [Akkermansiaceae bacterium]|jgi:Ca2+-binding EF-hand superfamily protein